MQITPELVTSVAGLVGAVGVLLKQVRDNRRTRRERRKTDKALEQVARAAAVGRTAVGEIVDELESTGTFQRPTPRNGDDG